GWRRRSAPGRDRRLRPGARPRRSAALGPHAREMAHLAPRPGFGLAVEVDMRVAAGGGPRPAVGRGADGVLHLDPAEALRRAERPAADGADMLLELRGHGALDRPMAGIGGPRRAP